MKNEIIAIVQDVVEGKHGPYAVATSNAYPDRSFTFSLEPPVWDEEQQPSKGTWVVLGNIQKKSAGWRAESARLYKIEDEQSASDPVSST